MAKAVALIGPSVHRMEGRICAMNFSAKHTEVNSPRDGYRWPLRDKSDTNREQVQASEMGFPRRVAGISLRDRVRALPSVRNSE